MRACVANDVREEGCAEVRLDETLRLHRFFSIGPEGLGWVLAIVPCRVRFDTKRRIRRYARGWRAM